MPKEKIILLSLLTLGVLGVSLYILDPAFSPLQASNKLSNRGAIKALNVGVYSEQSCSNKLPSIDWGISEPGRSQNATVYIRNEGNSAITLSFSTINWSPSNASSYITLDWDYEGQSIDQEAVVDVTFTLAVLTNISGIVNFSFDIVIIGTG